MKNEINTNIEKGKQLLSESIERYEAGKYDSAYEAYQAAGQFLSEAYKRSNTNDGKISMMYGGNRNFGVIYKVFESNTKELLKDNENVKKLGKIINLIRENEVLRNEFAVYNAFTNPINIKDVTEYVNEAIGLVRQYPINTIKSNNEKLIELIRECKLNEEVNVNEDEIELYENIEYMLLNKKDFNNINKYGKIQESLCEYVKENNHMITEGKSIDEIYEEKVNEVVVKHDNVLSEDEVKLIRDMNDKTKAKKLFYEHKNIAISCVEREIEKGQDVESWNNTLAIIKDKVYEQSTALSDVAKFIEVSNKLTD